jgi:trans-2,3-dihydro-3-hydroxyanthranilate isomerase
MTIERSQSAMQRRFVTLDVFTDRRFTGNPLGAVLEPEGLDTDTMQAITREFGHPETIFVFPPADPKHRAKVRIFTPGREIPFAGHPTVGAAVLLARIDGGTGSRPMVIEEGVGPVQCTAEPKGADRGSAVFVVPQLPAPSTAAPSNAAIAAALGIDVADVGFDGFKPGRWSAGNPFAFVPLRGIDAVGRARVDLAHFEPTFATAERPGMVFMFCRATAESGHDFHARMFAPGMGVPEDPATGSAAAAFAGVLAEQGRLPDGLHNVTIEQGHEMGRPSLLRLSVTLRAGKLAAATVGGDAVIATEGTIEA